MRGAISFSDEGRCCSNLITAARARNRCQNFRQMPSIDQLTFFTIHDHLQQLLKVKQRCGTGERAN